jgi:hypothetical protein
MRDAGRAYIIRRAREMAATGHHDDYLTIQNALLSQGYPEARKWLGTVRMRKELEKICIPAREKLAERLEEL